MISNLQATGHDVINHNPLLLPLDAVRRYEAIDLERSECQNHFTHDWRGFYNNHFLFIS